MSIVVDSVAARFRQIYLEHVRPLPDTLVALGPSATAAEQIMNLIRLNYQRV